MRKKVFICSPFRGDMEGNARKAAAYSRMACEEGCLLLGGCHGRTAEDGGFGERQKGTGKE